MSAEDPRDGEAGDHAAHMERALDLARSAAERGEVPVGAIVVDAAGAVVGAGRNRIRELNDPTAHAEMLALREAAARLGHWHLLGCTLYATLEPCAMCAGAAVLARVETIVIGAPDPKTGMCGSLENLVQDVRLNHHIEIIEGVRADECGRVLVEFFRAKRT